MQKKKVFIASLVVGVVSGVLISFMLGQPLWYGGICSILVAVTASTIVYQLESEMHDYKEVEKLKGEWRRCCPFFGMTWRGETWACNEEHCQFWDEKIKKCGMIK